MGKIKDLTGQVFFKLKVVKLSYIDPKYGAVWECICECGKTKLARGSLLGKGATKSCGCYQGEAAKERNTTHGMTKTRIYKCWQGMKSRCYYKRNIAYNRYGGRGIRVCPEWRNDFMSFYLWSMKNGYSDDLTLDRIETDGNYEPSNCRWANWEEQNQNRRDNVKLTYKNETKCASEWAKESGVTKATFMKRLEHWDLEKAITKESRGIRIEFNGERKTLKEWAKDLNVPYATLKTRYFRGLSPEEILTKEKFDYMEFKGKRKTGTEWAKEYGIPKSTFFKRLEYGWSLEKALTTEIRKPKTTN